MKIAILGEIHNDGLNLLNSEDFKVIIVNDFDTKNLISKLSDVDGIVIRTADLKSDILSKCTKLKIVSRHGVGYDNVDLNYLNEKKIPLAVTGQSNAISVAEHVMTMMLLLSKNILASDNLTRANGFNKKSILPDFYELYQKKILILGFGRIGQALAKRCLGFDMEVYVHDPFINNELILSKNCISIDINKGFEIADYISIHLPLNETTNNLISDDEFKLFKKNLILINTARGGIVDEEALYNALNNGDIHAAGLDVFKKEPPEENNKLFKLDNIILTPHNSALTIECRKRMSIESCNNVINFLKNKNNLNKSNIVNLDNINT